MYDFIGDIHGNFTLLVKLLRKLEYKRIDGVWQHPQRTAVFCGDFINRGEQIRRTIELIRTMHKNGKAHVILGNHEWSAIVYHIFQNSEIELPLRVKKTIPQIRNTRKEFRGETKEWKSLIKWLRTLPFFIELDGIKTVHACWDQNAVDTITKWIGEDNRMKKVKLQEVFHQQNDEILQAIYTLTRGPIFELPNDMSIKCSKGISRRSFRINWWNTPQTATFQQLAFGNKFTLPNYSIPKEIYKVPTAYPTNQPPVVFGHYCLGKGAQIVQENLVCIDSCVHTTRQLTAYQWQGEKTIDPKHIITV